MDRFVKVDFLEGRTLTRTILFALGKERGKKEGKGELVATVEEKWLVVILL